MARPRTKTSAADLLALSEAYRMVRDDIAPLLRRLGAVRSLEKLEALRLTLRQALAFRSRSSSISNPRIVLLTEELYREHLLPLRPGYAATLAEYQAKNPGITHGLFMGKRLVKLGRAKDI